MVVQKEKRTQKNTVSVGGEKVGCGCGSGSGEKGISQVRGER